MRGGGFDFRFGEFGRRNTVLEILVILGNGVGFVFFGRDYFRILGSFRFCFILMKDLGLRLF